MHVWLTWNIRSISWQINFLTHFSRSIFYWISEHKYYILKVIRQGVTAHEFILQSMSSRIIKIFTNIHANGECTLHTIQYLGIKSNWSTTPKGQMHLVLLQVHELYRSSWSMAPKKSFLFNTLVKTFTAVKISNQCVMFKVIM